MTVWRAIEVEGYTQQANRIFPFSKPSPFSSMTDWPLGSQQTMTNALQHTITIKAEKTMTKQETLHHQVNQQLTKFEKTMQELHLLKRVSKDLKNYRKMIKLKKYD
jgi:hypothetical protein